MLSLLIKAKAIMKRELNNHFRTQADAMKEQLSSWRRAFHCNAELSNHEYDTCKIIQTELDKIGGMAYRVLAGTSVVSNLNGENPGKTIALRTDMDALPIQEEQNKPYCSKNSGVMHACGHDAHMAMLLGAVAMLIQRKSELNGNVKFIFQASEEVPPGGAVALLEAGVMGNPKIDMILALHVQTNIEVGKISLMSGPAMANTDDFEISIIGKSGHGAHPDTAVDAIVISSMVVQAFQTIVSRVVAPIEPAVVTVGSFHGGTKSNIIAKEAILTGTVRTINEATRNVILNTVKMMLKSITEMYGGSYKIQLQAGYPALINHESGIKLLEQAAVKVMGEDGIIHQQKPSMGGEDFANYLKYSPGALCHIGAGNKNKGIVAPLHSSRFDIDEDCLALGAAILAQAALDFLNS